MKLREILNILKCGNPAQKIHISTIEHGLTFETKFPAEKIKEIEPAFRQREVVDIAAYTDTTGTATIYLTVEKQKEDTEEFAR